MADSSEQKKHLPTQIKLRRLRREGQIPRSRDMVTLAVVPILAWLVLSWNSIERGMRRLMAGMLNVSDVLEPHVIVSKVVPMAAWSLADQILPLLLVMVVLVLLLSILDAGGFVISAKMIAPRFDRLNPAEGLKRIFSARSASEMGIALIKLLLFSLLAFGLFWGAIGTIREVQLCGMKCTPQIFKTLILPIMVLSAIVYILAAIADFLVSRAMFRLEMRMTDTELKRENKETYGDPEVRRRRKDEGRSVASGNMKLGIANATLVITGRTGVVGLRFVQGETAAPMVVIKARGTAADEVLQLARAGNIPIMFRPGLAQVLDQRGLVGQFVPRDSFTDVASAIIAANG